MSSDTTETTTTTAGAGSIPGADSGAGTPAGSSTGGEERRFSQDDVNRFLAEEKRKAEEKQKAAEAQARQKAAEEAAKKAGEWEKLAGQYQAERDARAQEIERLSTAHAALREAAEGMVKDALKELPEEIRALAPGGDDLAARLAWVKQARAAAAKLAPAQPRTPGTPAGPRGTGGQQTPLGGDADELIRQKLASGRYGGL